MERLKDIDDSIVHEARLLLSLVKISGPSELRVRSPADVPLLLLCAFELLTAETIKDKPFRTPVQRARTLQNILDTLEQTLKLPLGHISGEGLARLDRRQLADAIQIFIDVIKLCCPDRDIKTGTPEGRRLTLSQLETPELGRIIFNMTSTPEFPIGTVRQKEQSVATITPKQVPLAKVTKPPAALKRRSSTRPGLDKDKKAKEASREKSKETTSSTRSRRPSVVSTKVRKHGSGSQSSPVPLSRNSLYRQPVRRGKVSSQTSSLCSSIKLLEEFDYIDRRLKEITQQKEKLMDIIKELEHEETRLQYVMSHIHQQAGKSMKKATA